MELKKINHMGFGKVFSIFIIALLVITFLSKSFYNYRLPEVKVEVPIEGRFVFKAEGTSEITYSRESCVYASVSGRISEICVKSGDEVQSGQCVMKLQVQDTDETVEVTAKDEGIITYIGIEEGMYVSSIQNTVLYKIAAKSDDYVCTLFITEDQYKFIKAGSSATVQFFNTDVSVEGYVEKIVSYAERDRTGYLATIIIHSEDKSLAGMSVELTIREESEIYDTLIPVSALHKDAVGYYVLVLEKENSVLGMGYKAHRMSVDLLNSDQVYCAVRGLPGGEKVIVAATGEISDGSNVYYIGE